ncbi:TetR/AcrR family transcriptional regulator [Frankia sp. AiPa1]|uniref:TetR/AcrR family transcriptional regulator n=1 Tax=Frankia sp. AiPa1 TaxID=573492 RepID=UPI00202B5D61|nr:TetR/AcrR family transcriptional regulator C-terminal domain-containing protein [Frankia sp. AiPa1]MCL9760109.1 TetR/AcrR family transcriptional regulator C-terminal domain-containing protein [Frankia sp. AiPa1]
MSRRSGPVEVAIIPAASPAAASQATPAPEGRRGAGPGCRSKLNPERLARAAIEIADADGLSAVSMRRLASHLGVGTMTLYYHVRDKDDLLDLMWDEFMGESLLAEVPAGWRAGLTAIARRNRETYQRHPWTLHVVARPARGPNKLRFLEQYLGVVSQITDDPLEQQRILHSVNDLIIGCTLREVSTAYFPRRAAPAENDPTALAQMIEPDFGALPDGEELPRLRHLWSIGCLLSAPRFERALGWLLDGIEASHPKAGWHGTTAADSDPPAAQPEEAGVAAFTDTT